MNTTGYVVRVVATKKVTSSNTLLIGYGNNQIWIITLNSYFDQPVEGDCDLCGEFIDTWAIPHCFHKQKGTLTCVSCQELEKKHQPKGKYNEN